MASSSDANRAATSLADIIASIRPDPTEPAPVAAGSAPVAADERVREIGRLRKLLARPEFGAVAGTVMVFLLFGLSAGGSGMFSAEGVINWGTVAAFLGILAAQPC